jgi:hypothetical protein
MGQCSLHRMSVNPIFTESHLQSRLNSAFIKHAHKLVVHAVYDWKRPVKEEVFDEMRVFCKEYHIHHELREFLPEPLEEDRENIVKLPAFQIYVEDEYEKTAYPDDFIAVITAIVVNLDQKPPKPVRWTFRLPTLPSFTLKRRSIAASVAPTNEYS